MNNFVVTINNEKFSINTDHLQGVKINGTKHEVEVSKLSEHTYKIKLGSKIFHVTTNKLDSSNYSFLIDGHYLESNVRTKLEDHVANILKGSSSNNNNKIKSPMPGLILRLNKKVGDKVNVGDSIILLEAMKMENEIKSHSQGTISKILVQKGNSVEKNQTLIILK